MKSKNMIYGFAVFMLALLALAFNIAIASTIVHADAGASASPSSSQDNSSNSTQITGLEASSMINIVEYNLTILKSKGYRMEHMDDLLLTMKDMYSQKAYSLIPMQYDDAAETLSEFMKASARYDHAGTVLSFIEDKYPQIDTLAIRQEYSQGYNSIDNSDYTSAEYILSGVESNLSLVLDQLFENESEDIDIMVSKYDTYNNYTNSKNSTNSLATNSSTINSSNISYQIASYTNMLSLITAYEHLHSEILRIRSSPGTYIDPVKYPFGKVDIYYDALLAIDRLRDADTTLKNLDTILQGMGKISSEGYATSRLDEEYTMILDSYDSEDYGSSLTLSEDMVVSMDSILKLSENIAGIETYLKNNSANGVDYSSAKYFLDLCVEEFSTENYEQAGSYLSSSRQAIDDSESKSALGIFLHEMQSKYDIAGYIREHIIGIALWIIMIAAVASMTVFFAGLFILNGRINSMLREQDIIISLIKRLQMAYFKDKDIDSDTYHLQYDSYQNRHADIRRELPILNEHLLKKISRLEKFTFGLSTKVFGDSIGKVFLGKDFSGSVMNDNIDNNIRIRGNSKSLDASKPVSASKPVKTPDVKNAKASNVKTSNVKTSNEKTSNAKSLIMCLFFALFAAMMLLSLLSASSSYVSAKLVYSNSTNPATPNNTNNITSNITSTSNNIISAGSMSSGPSSTNSLSTGSASIILDKEYYESGESVDIFLSYPSLDKAKNHDSMFLEVSLKEDPSYNLRYLGIVDDNIVFIPTRAGNYIIRLYKDKGAGAQDAGTQDVNSADVVLVSEKSFVVYTTDTLRCKNSATLESVNITFHDYEDYVNTTPKSVMMIFSYINDKGLASSEKWVYNQDIKDSITFNPSREGKYSLFAEDKYLDCFNVSGPSTQYHQQVIQYVGNASGNAAGNAADGSGSSGNYSGNVIGNDLGKTYTNPLDNSVTFISGGYQITDTLLEDSALRDSSFTMTSHYDPGNYLDEKQQLALSVIGDNFYADEAHASKVRSESSNASGNYSYNASDNPGIVIMDSKDNIVNAYIILSQPNGTEELEGNMYDLDSSIKQLRMKDAADAENNTVQKQAAGQADSKYNMQDNKYDTQIYLSHDTVKKISLNRLNYTGEKMDLYLEGVDPDTILSKEYGKADRLRLNNRMRKAIDIFAIDPARMDFTDGSITIQAAGTELYKCREWNFTEERCYGEWVKISDLAPGEFYNITLTPDDPAYAQTIQPDAATGLDTDLDQSLPTTNTGTSVSIRVDDRNTRQLRALIIFNVSSIPANAKIRYAGLQLYQTSSSGGSFNAGVYRMTKGWVETQATWNVNQTGTNWASAGGDFAAASYNITNLTITSGAWKEWNVTKLVQEWVNGTYANYGLIIMNSSTGAALTDTKTFASSDNATAAYRPKLVINYSIDNSGISLYNETGMIKYAIGGTFNRTLFDNYTTYSVLLNNTASPTNGTWTSTVFDGTNNVTWRYVSWSSIAIGELPNNKTAELFGNGNVNMANNILLYHMNDSSGNITDYSKTGNDGTNFGAAYLASGKLGSAMDFNGVSNYIHVNDNPTIDLGANGTISLWLYKRGNFSNRGLVHKGDLANFSDEAVSLQYFPTNISLYLKSAGGAVNTVTGPALSDNVWYNVVGTWDQTRAAVYVNGVLVKTQANNITPMNSAGGLNIGCQINSSPYYPFNGTIDEVAIWNVSLSDAEITSLYERGVVRLNLSARSCNLANCSDSNFTFIGSSSPQAMALPVNRYFQFQYQFARDDVTQNPEIYNLSIYYVILPNSTLITPSDATYTNNNTVNFTCNATDDTLLRNMTLYWNYTGVWGYNSTTNVSGKANRTSFTFNNLGDGMISWNCLACDNSSGCSFASSNRTVTIDTQSPTITYVNPTDGNNSYIARNWSIVNITSSEPLANCTLNWSGALSNMINISASIWYVNKTFTPDGNYNYYVYCRDYANNTGISSKQNITRDMILPTVALNTPLNAAAVVQSSILFNYTPTDINMANCSLYGNFTGIFAIDQTNSTSIASGQPNNFTKSLSDGTYIWNIGCVDKASNNAFAPANYTLYVDTTPPSIYLGSPTNNTLINATNNITFYYNVTDAMTGISSCSLILNGSIYSSNSSITEGVNQNFTANIANGRYNWSVNCTDMNGLKSSSQINNITVFVPTVPRFTLMAPLNNSGDSDMNVTISYNVTGGNILNCSLMLNGLVNATNSSINTSQMQSFTLNSLAIAKYNWSVTCINDEPTVGTSAAYYFDIIYATNFAGSTTDFSTVDVRNITNLTIDDSGIGTIRYCGYMDLSNGTDINGIIDIQGNDSMQGDAAGNAIIVDTVSDPRFNRSAILTMYGLSYNAAPIIYADGAICTDCMVMNYTPQTGTLVFNVTHFTAYTTGKNANMTIWDDSDSQGGSIQKFFGMQTKFYANYTNKSSGSPVSGAACNITFSNSTSMIGTGLMQYNASSKLYVYNRSFASYATYIWNVTCNATAQGYELLKAQDSIKIYNNATLTVTNIRPVISMNVSRNRMFNYTLNISCVAGYCDNVAAILDPSSWWDSNWKYRKQMTFSMNSSSTPSNYQVQITLNSSNVGAGWNWSNECVGGVDSRIRFVNVTDNALLGYWVHDCSIAGQNMTLWLKLDQNITAGTNYTINMYYGNPMAASGSNGTAAFDFFDDFSGDLSKWTRHDISGIYPDIENGYMVAGGGTTSGNYGHTTLGSDATYSGFLDGIIEGDIYLTTDSISEIGFRGIYASNTGYKSRNDGRAGQGLSFLTPPYAGWGFLAGCAVSGTPVSLNTWLPFGMTVSGSNFTEIVGGQTETCTDTTYNSAGEISLQNHYGSYTNYDNIRVRKYSTIIPKYVLGTEQYTGPKDTMIPVYDGTAYTPFYTITANPMGPANSSCLAGMNAGNSCQITWMINATGNANTLWYFYALMNWTGTDLQSNQTNITIMDDNNPPRIISPSLNATMINQSEKVALNVTIIDETNIESATTTIKYPNGTSKDYILTKDPYTSGSWTLSFTDTNNTGIYNFTNITATDQAGNVNNTNYRNLTFTVTLSPPGNFNLLTPVNGTESTNLLPTLSWQQTTESTFSNYTLLISTDNTFATVLSTYVTTSITNTSQTMTYALDANTRYYWRVKAYDIFGSSTNSTQDFTYVTDMTNPTVQLNNPADNIYIKSSQASFNYTPSDSNTLNNCSLYGNFSGAWAKNSTNNSVLNGQPDYFNIALPDGIYLWNVVCYDNSGNMGTAVSSRHIKVDTTPPSINLISPSNNSYENATNNKVFVVNATDAMSNLNSCSIIIDGAVEQTKTGMTNGVLFNFTRFVMNGNHSWSVNCTDTNGFEGSSQKYNITFNVVDTDPPLVTLNYPAQNSYAPTGNITFNYTPEDATGIQNCTIYLDGISNQTITAIDNLVPNYVNITGITQGTHQWNVTCYDNSTQKNKGVSSVHTFIVDMINPAVTLNSPSNGASSNTSTISFSYTPTDTNLDTCSLYGNFTGIFANDQTNTTPANGQQNTFSKTLSDGRYIWDVICIDKSGRMGYASSNYTLLVDTIPPSYSNPSSTPITPATYNPAATYKFNITWIDGNAVDKVLFESNFSGVMQNVTAYNLGGGIYTVNITGVNAGNYAYRWNANDTLNNMNTTQYYGYTVQQTTPTLSLMLNFTSANISINEGSAINITAASTTPASGYIELYIGNSTTAAMINSGASPISNNTLFANPGLYNVSVHYPATQNYAEGYKNYYLNVNDTTPPNITLLYPANNATVGTSTVIFQYQVQDASAIQNCSIYINNTLNQTDTGVDTGEVSTFSIDFADGNYTWRLRCIDIYGNAANSTTRNFTERHTTGMIFNINTTNITHEQGEPIQITESAKDSYQNPLSADVGSAIIYLNTTITTIPWFDGSWNYRMPINMTENNASNLTNYQVNITINTTGIIASGKMNANCSDMRFADSMATQISYWIAGGCNSSATTVWLKMNLTASQNKTIYLYYGNMLAQDGSNGTNVFDYYDDGNYLPSWTVAGTAGQTAAQGLPLPSYYAASASGNYMYRNASLTTNRILEFNVRSDGLGGLFFLTNSTGAGQHFRAETRTGNSAGVGPAASWALWSVPSQTCAVISMNTWYNFSLVIGSTTSQAYINGAACGGAYTFTNNGPYIGLVGDALGPTFTTWWDNLRVRKYIAQIPTSTVIYTEQAIISWNYNTTSYIDGNFSYIFNSTSQPYGNYSVVGLASSTGFYSASNSTYFYLGQDLTAPQITLLTPTDLQDSGIGTFDFTYRPYDYNLKNCTLYIDINGTFKNMSSTSVLSNNQTNTFTGISLGLGSYRWNVKCYDTYGNNAFSGNNYTLNITGPDLTVSSGSIIFSSADLVEGNNITVYANITNAGLSAFATPSIMQFYYGDPSLGGIQIGQNITIQNMSVGETRTINSTYSLKIGNNNIFVLVDAANTVNETDESNNKANNSITVGMYQYYYGNVTTNVLLGTSDDSLILGNYNVSSNTGYIFVANIASTFSFTDLQALGRNKNNNTVGNDFSDLDTNMNTTGYTDSVDNIWAGGTDTPIMLRQYNISGKIINNVSTVYSTNNTNFETGILWDTADDASHNFQYDTIDDEDIVFATRQGAAKQGKYGTYNYEIKVPAILRSYKGQSDTVVFYYEIE